MKTNKLAVIILLLCVALGGYAKKKEYPRSDIKVSYNYHKKYLKRGSDKVSEIDIPFVLLANATESKFFCPSSEYKDSLESTPSGRALYKQMFDAAFKKYWESKDLSDMDGVTYKTQLYVFKSKTDNEYNVYDYVGMPGYFCYREPIDNIPWEISDSTKVILDYECIMATANYHERQWAVWFAPEIPVQDGPWKFCGLPGLILEASEPSGQHYFIADGLEASKEEIVPMYNKKRYEKTSRIEMLKIDRKSRENNMSMINAELGLNLGPDAPVTEETRKYDFLETDYH